MLIMTNHPHKNFVRLECLNFLACLLLRPHAQTGYDKYTCTHQRLFNLMRMLFTYSMPSTLYYDLFMSAKSVLSQPCLPCMQACTMDER